MRALKKSSAESNRREVIELLCLKIYLCKKVMQHPSWSAEKGLKGNRKEEKKEGKFKDFKIKKSADNP